MSLQDDSSYHHAEDRRTVFLEICAGSAALSAAMQRKGWQVFQIDYHANRFKNKVHIFELDLSLHDSVSLLESLIEQMRPKGAHFGLMCGTCSRAREVPVARALRSQGAPSPMPLRDALHPLGLPNVGPMNQQRIDAANTVYRHAVRLCNTGEPAAIMVVDSAGHPGQTVCA